MIPWSQLRRPQVREQPLVLAFIPSLSWSSFSYENSTKRGSCEPQGMWKSTSVRALLATDSVGWCFTKTSSRQQDENVGNSARCLRARAGRPCALEAGSECQADFASMFTAQQLPVLLDISTVSDQPCAAYTGALNDATTPGAFGVLLLMRVPSLS